MENLDRQGNGRDKVFCASSAVKVKAKPKSRNSLPFGIEELDSMCCISFWMNNVHLQKTSKRERSEEWAERPECERDKGRLTWAKSRKNRKPSSLPSAVSKALAGLVWSGCLEKVPASAAQAVPPWLRAPCCQRTLQSFFGGGPPPQQAMFAWMLLSCCKHAVIRC